MKPDEFYTIAADATAELTVKGSRFLARAFPAQGREAAENRIQEISAKFADATHNCFAYKIGPGDGAVFRYSDDGEPSGTAGKPIYQAIESRGVTNLAIVVTRYFGGTKLGTGGLIRAYGGVAAETLKRAQVVRVFAKATLEIAFNYELSHAVHHCLNRFNAGILSSDFATRSVLRISVARRDVEALESELRDCTRGQIDITEL